MVDCRINSYQYVDKITEIVSKFPTIGSNAFLRNFYDFENPSAQFKIFRLSLNDFTEISDEDIDLRSKIILDSINGKGECDTEKEQKLKPKLET